MRTFDQVMNALFDNLFKENHDILNYEELDPDKRYPKEFVEFAHEIEHYFSIGLKFINAKVIKFYFSGYEFYFFFELAGNFYTLSVSRWGGTSTLYAVPEYKYNKPFDYLYCYKHTEISLSGKVTPEDLFRVIKLPRHARYKIGDLVYISSKIRKTYYGSYTYNKHKNTIYKIIGVDYKSSAVWYSIEDIDAVKPAKYPDSFAETNLVKFNGGV